MGLFTKNRARTERHINRLNEMVGKKEMCDDLRISFPLTELEIPGKHGVTTVSLAFEGSRILVTASYDQPLTYAGRDRAYLAFMRLNRQPDKKFKEKWTYGIDVEQQKMVFTEQYRMHNKLTESDRRLRKFVDRIFGCVPQIFDTIQSKAKW